MTAFFRSMAGRVFLILLCGIASSVALTWWFAFGERQRALAQVRESRVAEQVEQFVRTLDETPPAERRAFIRSTRRFGLRIELPEQDQGRIKDDAAAPEDGLAKALGERLGPEYRILSLPENSAYCPALRARRPERREEREARFERAACEAMQVRLQDGTEIRIAFLQPRGTNPPLPPAFNLYLGFFLCSIAGLAYLVSRIATQPLSRLAQAATDLGHDIDRPALSLDGSPEIRQAATAFNAMQQRIRNHIRQRSQMLAAITHDLQTPLTRLRLRLEKVQDPELREKLVDDLAQTQALVREGLDLARSMDSSEPLQSLDIDSLLDSLCSDALEAGQPVSLHGRAGVQVPARPLALRRCLTNLIDNAVKYGGSAEISVELLNAGPERTGKGDARPDRVRIVIADRGPGLPDEELQKVFEPFYRLEGSRSRQTGGTGLGLTIAKNIAEQHGGSLALKGRSQGGLEAVLLLPVHGTR